jgi:hypothetical protein
VKYENESRRKKLLRIKMKNLAAEYDIMKITASVSVP